MFRPTARTYLLALPLLIIVGCASRSGPVPRTEAEMQMFGPVSMRIHPIFTRIKDWTGDNIPDGIDALLEFQDQFGDPTKAAGKVLFELYQFQKFSPERKGVRIANPWPGSIMTEREQRDRWNRTSRTYAFPLSFPGIRQDLTYVLAAQFTMANGRRFFDEIILEPAFGTYTPKLQRVPATATSEPSATQPAFGAPTSAPSGGATPAAPATGPAAQPPSDVGTRPPSP